MSEDQILQLLKAYTTFTVQACAGTDDDRVVMNKWGNEMYLNRFIYFANAIRALTIAEFEYVDITVCLPEGLIAALHRQKQIDEDGDEVGVSRQAVDTAIELLEKFAQSDCQKTNQINAQMEHMDHARLQGRLEAFAMAMTECEKAEPRNDGYVGGRTWVEVRKAIDILHLHTLVEIKALENGS